MVATKVPYGAISESLIATLLPPRKDGKFYIIDTGGNWFEVSSSTYNDLKRKGYKVYEGRIEKTGIIKL